MANTGMTATIGPEGIDLLIDNALKGYVKSVRRTVESAYEVGTILNEAKKRIPRGKFEAWRDNHIKGIMSRTTAYNSMVIAKAFTFEEVEGKSLVEVTALLSRRSEQKPSETEAIPAAPPSSPTPPPASGRIRTTRDEEVEDARYEEVSGEKEAYLPPVQRKTPGQVVEEKNKTIQHLEKELLSERRITKQLQAQIKMRADSDRPEEMERLTELRKTQTEVNDLYSVVNRLKWENEDLWKAAKDLSKRLAQHEGADASLDKYDIRRAPIPAAAKL